MFPPKQDTALRCGSEVPNQERPVLTLRQRLVRFVQLGFRTAASHGSHSHHHTPSLIHCRSHPISSDTTPVAARHHPALTSTMPIPATIKATCTKINIHRAVENGSFST